MKLTDEEHKKLDECIETLKEMFEDQVNRTPQSRAKVDNEFVKMIGEKYISPTGLFDFLVDYEMISRPEECSCSRPCHNSCVEPCASACNAHTYDACHVNIK